MFAILFFFSLKFPSFLSSILESRDKINQHSTKASFLHALVYLFHMMDRQAKGRDQVCVRILIF